MMARVGNVRCAAPLATLTVTSRMNDDGVTVAEEFDQHALPFGQGRQITIGPAARPFYFVTG